METFKSCIFFSKINPKSDLFLELKILNSNVILNEAKKNFGLFFPLKNQIVFYYKSRFSLRYYSGFSIFHTVLKFSNLQNETLANNCTKYTDTVYAQSNLVPRLCT